MKKLLLLLFLIPNLVFAETWVCSGKTSSGKVEIKTYQRDGNSFKKLSQFGKSSFEILKENRKFIILAETYDFDAIFVTFLSKENNSFTEDYLTPQPEFTTTKMRGNCLID